MGISVAPWPSEKKATGELPLRPWLIFYLIGVLPLSERQADRRAVKIIPVIKAGKRGVVAHLNCFEDSLPKLLWVLISQFPADVNEKIYSVNKYPWDSHRPGCLSEDMPS